MPIADTGQAPGPFPTSVVDQANAASDLVSKEWKGGEEYGSSGQIPGLALAAVLDGLRLGQCSAQPLHLLHQCCHLQGKDVKV